MIQPHAHKLITRIIWIIPILSRGRISPRLLHSSRVRRRAADDLCDEFCREGGEVAKDEMTIGVWWVFRERGWVFEVVEGHSCQYRDQNIVVREICVELLFKGEVVGVAVLGCVDGGVGGCDGLVLQAGDEFLEVAYALGATLWV